MVSERFAVTGDARSPSVTLPTAVSSSLTGTRRSEVSRINRIIRSTVSYGATVTRMSLQISPRLTVVGFLRRSL